MEIIRWAKQAGVDVTAEVTPHHLLLTEELARGYDARYKVNPPLRREEDVRGAARALADGTIDIVATDHAPHPAEAKACEWQAAANGMVGLESALRVVQLAMVDPGLLNWADVAARDVGRRARASARLARVRHAARRSGSRHPSPFYDASPARTRSADDLVGPQHQLLYIGRRSRRCAGPPSRRRDRRRWPTSRISRGSGMSREGARDHRARRRAAGRGRRVGVVAAHAA